MVREVILQTKITKL